MNICLYCGKETKNLKYCNKSCQMKKRNRDNNPMANKDNIEKMRKKVIGMIKKPRSVESNKKISQSLTGRKLPEEVKQKISLTLKESKKNWKPNIDIDQLTHIVKNSYSFYEVSKKLHINKTTIKQWIVKLKIDYSHFKFLNKSDDKSDFQKYKRNVWLLTNRVRKKLFDMWDGKCYYTCVILNKKDTKLIPTIDHKISCRFGYDNNINPEIIADISNLCICARWYNSFKHTRTLKDHIIVHAAKLLKKELL
jgi:hypothetical protein